MASFNPFTNLLTQNKLEDSNYMDWKRNLAIVFTAEEYKFLLTELCPEKPGDGASEQDTNNLKEMFRDQTRVAKKNALRELLTSKMEEGTLVRDHVLRMMSLLNDIEVLGVEANKESQVEMVLHTLLASFQQFRLNHII
ncbi:uncharacterized protein LOC119370768 [Jatropha curcas]|uniref:uncharacterized protein LOC119370768 n=1 Tax=Jatropha curcas TaxID=180498 RepID=UPI0018940C12|nr:uncharacterized protein LOC119370768 [Jatropha curcas]